MIVARNSGAVKWPNLFNSSMAAIFALMTCIMVMSGAQNATAQSVLTGKSGEQSTASVKLPDPLTPEAVRQLVARLSDAEVRALLLQRLDTLSEVAQKKEKSGGIKEFALRATVGVYEKIAEAVSRTPLIWNSQIISFTNFFDQIGENGFLILSGILLLGLIGGILAEQLMERTMRRWHDKPDQGGTAQTLKQSVSFLSKRLCQDIAGVVLFFIAAKITMGLLARFVFDGHEQIMEIKDYNDLFLFNLIFLPRMGAAIARFVMAPNKPEYRLVHANDDIARTLARHTVGLFLLVGFSRAIFIFNDMNGIAMGESRLGFWLNLAIHLYVGIVAWQCRDGLRAMMRGVDPDLSRIEARVAWAYPGFVIGVSIGAWYLAEIIVTYGMFELLAGAPHIIMMMLLCFAPALDTLVRGLVRHLTPPMVGEGAIAEAAYRAAKKSYIRIGRVIVFALVIYIIAKVWQIDFHNLASAGVGAQLAGRLIGIIMVVAFGYFVWELVSLWINRKLAAEQTAAGLDQIDEEEPGGGEGGGTGVSRLSTVLPLLLGVARVAIVTVFGLIALGNIGIDITPLLAGAGIVGLAVGFGAQKLVSDVVSGMFFLIDDAFRTGEYVEVDGTFGTVEKISVRSMQLRHHKGPVHTIPYGEIPKLTNYSRDWVIMKLKFTVPFETDPNRVKKLFKKIGAEMMEVPEYAEDLLQPFKSQGVFDFDDVGMIIRGKFMAKPGKQFVLRKEIYNRVKKEFADNGIEFARREVRVAIPGLDGENNLTEDQKAAIGATAAQAAQDAVAGGPDGTKS